MGHQVLAQAYGGTTFKLKFGHRGLTIQYKIYVQVVYILHLKTMAMQ